MRRPGERRENPFHDPQVKPGWAQLTRLAGDRAAILFEDLRRRLGDIEGLQEKLDYRGPAWGWAPCYRLSGAVLCTVRVLPALLDAGIELDSNLKKKLLGSSKVAATLKRAIREAPFAGDTALVHLELPNPAAVRAFAGLVLAKARSITATRAN